ncbi:hypothetical protein CPB84DRAFT_1748901 [Gymnopilus junonius]|uniref:Uncharacterized protein n=1 Tax=Gymnopilus junonius TaxID=109634 RepID=A0A9P5TK99_GYMJU|nr:hypothetical protein CPB84DRAFT_1748901 [Gymnopilus junonius]
MNQSTLITCVATEVVKSLKRAEFKHSFIIYPSQVDASEVGKAKLTNNCVDIAFYRDRVEASTKWDVWVLQASVGLTNRLYGSSLHVRVIQKSKIQPDLSRGRETVQKPDSKNPENLDIAKEKKQACHLAGEPTIMVKVKDKDKARRDETKPMSKGKKKSNQVVKVNDKTQMVKRYTLNHQGSKYPMDAVVSNEQRIVKMYIHSHPSILFWVTEGDKHL